LTASFGGVVSDIVSPLQFASPPIFGNIQHFKQIVDE